MTALTLAARDSGTMLRRNLKHALRYPSLTLIVAGMPIVFLLMFVYVFGGTLGAGLGGEAAGGRTEYANYLAPGILILTVAGGGQGTAISIAMDMTEGIIARFKTMAISRAAVLTGHVVGTMIQTALGLVAVVAVALLVGFRPDANVFEWAAAIGLLALVALALTWFCAACGLAAKSVETASNIPMPLLLLPFLGSGFVPTDSMPPVLQQFAEHQPFTPIIETLRGLLTDRPIGNQAWVALAWCAAIGLVGYLWSKRLYNREG